MRKVLVLLGILGIANTALSKDVAYELKLKSLSCKVTLSKAGSFEVETKNGDPFGMVCALNKDKLKCKTVVRSGQDLGESIYNLFYTDKARSAEEISDVVGKDTMNRYLANKEDVTKMSDSDQVRLSGADQMYTMGFQSESKNITLFVHGLEFHMVQHNVNDNGTFSTKNCVGAVIR